MNVILRRDAADCDVSLAEIAQYLGITPNAFCKRLRSRELTDLEYSRAASALLHLVKKRDDERIHRLTEDVVELIDSKYAVTNQLEDLLSAERTIDTIKQQYARTNPRR